MAPSFPCEAQHPSSQSGLCEVTQVQDLADVEKSVLELGNKLAGVVSSLDSLREDIRVKVSAYSDKNAPKAGTFASSTANASSPPTYADIAASEVVKKVISQTLAEQCKLTLDKSTLVVYGFPEEGDDYDELLAMFECPDCHCDVIRHQRMGHAARNNVGRPIKVELRSPRAAGFILSNIRRLKDDAYYTGVKISKWLSAEELRELKSLRQRCNKLNEVSVAGNQMQKKFVVISGKIMVRSANGKLQLYSNSSPTVPGAATVSNSNRQQDAKKMPSTSSKNVTAGSQ